MALALTTKLDAVNAMLESVWETPVSTLSVSGINSVAQAVRVLDRTTRAVLSRGWAFNTDKSITMAVTFDPLADPVPGVAPTGTIPLPADTLHVDSVDEDKGRDVVQRDGMLYDRDNNTFLFDRPIKVKIIHLLDFESIPETARAYIAVAAARVFRDKWLQKDTPSNPTTDEMEALRDLEDAEADSGDYNMFTDAYSVASILERF